MQVAPATPLPFKRQPSNLQPWPNLHEFVFLAALLKRCPLEEKGSEAFNFSSERAQVHCGGGRKAVDPSRVLSRAAFTKVSEY